MYQGPVYKRKINPRETSWLLSLITFVFTLPIIKKGFKSDLQEEDLYEVIGKYKSSKLGDEFEEEWKKELTRPKPSLTKFLGRKFGKTIIGWGFLKLAIRLTYMVVKPLSIGKLVSYFSPGSTMTLIDAYKYAGVITLVMLIQPSFNHTYYLRLTEAAQQVRIGLCSLIYRKSLKLSTSSLTEITNGKIVTMITKDVMLFETMMQFVNEVWIGIMQVIVMTYVMYKQIGVSALIGVGFLVALTPVQGFLAKLTMSTKLKTLSKSDERIRLIQEILSTIQIIKIYTWENYFRKLVDKIRSAEIAKIRLMYYLKFIVIIIGSMSTKVSYYICILSYTMFNNSITAEKAFVTLSCYGAIQHALNIAIPIGISQFAETKSSIKRIKKFLLSPEVDDQFSGKIYENISPTLYTLSEKEKSVAHFNKPPPQVKTVGLSVEILRNQPILTNISLQFERGLYAVCGPVGCGKSTLLKALLNDLRIIDGKLHVTGDVSYASQDPWLFPGTIRQNILFGQTYEHERYNKVVDICGLRRDFEILAGGDNTLVRDRGLNLSKGQQARVNLARAIYKEADVYLLDNPLAALDATVSKLVFHNCLKEFLHDKLSIVVMHQVQFLKEVDKILAMKEGTLEAQGTYDDLIGRGVSFGGDSVEEHAKGDEAESEKEGTESNDGDDNETTKLLKHSTTDLHRAAAKMYSENQKEGKVDWSVYTTYFKMGGGWKTIPLIFFFSIGTQIFSSSFEYFISYWIGVEEQIYVLQKNNSMNTTEYEDVMELRAAIPMYYSIILMLTTIFTLSNSVYIFIIFGIANKRLHNFSFWSIMQAPMAFFDQNLSGNILNRFTKDINTVDEHIPFLYYQCIRMTMIVIGVIVLVSIVKWGFLFVSIAFAIILAIAQKIYLPTSRSLKRLDGVTRSPVVGHLNASLEGLTTIRASGVQNILEGQFDRHQDLHSSASYMYMATNRAFGFYTEFFCVCYSMIVMFSLLIFPGASSGKVGLALNMAFALGVLLQYCTRQWTELENQMTCIERVLEYSHIKSEDKSGSKPPHWPTKGRLQYVDVEMKYPKTNQLVLKGMSFTVEPGQKIGIIGRTGAGKTSIMSALFRLYDIHEGSIFIDDINICDVALDYVRSKISIIPQNPILFSGSIRNNLDPNIDFEDNCLWRALEDVGMKKIVADLPSQLEFKIDDGGTNFSSGQKQLICLARAILQNNKIIVLDEATANIDLQTDAFIQETIKEKFGHCTILMIAHRLNTVLDSDKVMVVNNGNIDEFDRPEVLLNDKNSSFYFLVSQSGLLKK